MIEILKTRTAELITQGMSLRDATETAHREATDQQAAAWRAEQELAETGNWGATAWAAENVGLN